MTQQSEKHQRTCISCRKQAAKSELLRVVRDASGLVSFDPTGRAAGRGAYVCSDACFSTARKARKFERALRTKLTEEDYKRIAGELVCVIGETA